MPIQTLNPTTEVVEKTFAALTAAELTTKLERSAAGFAQNRRLSFTDRALHMRNVATLLEERSQSLGRLITVEMGKPLASAIAEVEKCATVCRYYAENAEQMLSDDPVTIESGQAFRRYLPLGPVLAVMPWNYPFWQVMRFAAPALMAGNSALLKHASNVPQSALALAELFSDAGFPPEFFQTLLIGADQVESVIADRRVQAVTLTGSGPAGAAVAATAGQHIKKSVLELGGTDPFLVMPSANLDAAVTTAVQGRTQNNGQSCIAAKRFIVHQDVYAEFRDRMVAEFEALEVGDPLQDGVDIGPLATASGRDELLEQVEATVTAGAQRLTGATAIDGTGYFVKPGILDQIPESSPGYSDEFFGPVALLFQAKDFDTAISIANASDFGLGSAIFTNDPEEISQASERLEAGATFVNRMVASDARLPFGGIKASGYGRELAAEGIREFVNLKTVVIAD